MLGLPVAIWRSLPSA